MVTTPTIHTNVIFSEQPLGVCVYVSEYTFEQFS